MAESSDRNKPHSSSWGLLNDHRFVCRKSTMNGNVENAQNRRKLQQKNNRIACLKRKRIENVNETLDTNTIVKKPKSSHKGQVTHSDLHSKDTRTDVCETGHQLFSSQTCVSEEPKAPARPKLSKALRDIWEVDSGFSSETSPPASGRSSPCQRLCPTTVVALDCEMVGTGPGGRSSELARCSILDYHGNVLYDQYIHPCQPVTDFRTRWSGIQKHHLHNAVPFYEARKEILSILEGKVVVGHSVDNDFQALDTYHPGHMVRDTSRTRHLTRLAGFARGHCASLKILTNKLLNRRIQVGRGGHNSVEDALASLDLYKLVEGEWELELQETMRDGDAPLQPNPAASNHYMQDQYWPDHLTHNGQ